MQEHASIGGHKMEKDILENYLKAGSIASEVIKEIKKEVKPGILLLDIAEKIESSIIKKGGHPAFPVNLSINDIAAHYTPVKNDKTIFNQDDILKIDLGVHIDGYVCDTAFTIIFDEHHRELVKASELALEEAVKLCTPDTAVNEISEVIEDAITSYGFRPIANLTGHGLQRFGLHTEPQIPNVKNKNKTKLEEDDVIAIEPFATTGEGLVKDSGNAMIFSLLQRKTVRNPEARKIIDFSEKMNNLPFAERWIPVQSVIKTKLAMRELLEKGIIHEYPPLREVKNGLVSQAEHTVIVKDKPIITSA
jgi:methionyl aminopeptidase